MPPSGLPSLCSGQSGGSSSRVMVTAPFSVIPHSATMVTPSPALTCWTADGGIGSRAR